MGLGFSFLTRLSLFWLHKNAGIRGLLCAVGGYE